jgi:peptidoglycan/xylan/chitin deacetylase (PgdA/CDA1 family)
MVPTRDAHVNQGIKKLAKRTGLRRRHVAAARMCCERHVLSTVSRVRRGAPAAPRAGGRILCYHSVGQPQWGVNDVRPQRFREQLELALADGFRFVPASEIVRTGGTPTDLAITFDDGLKSVITQAAPILTELAIPWSLFVVSEWADGHHAFGEDVMLDWAEIERCAALGAEIGSHSATHPDFGRLDAEQSLEELVESRDVITDRLGIAPSTFAIPLGQSGNWTAAATTAARDAGYTTVYAQAERTRPAATVARTFVSRFDNDRVFRAALRGAFDGWEEWI